MIAQRKAERMRENKAIQVDLGAQKAALERRLQSGLYDDASDVMRAALRALEREEAVLDEVLHEKVKASMADKRPSIPAADVFKRLRARHGRRVKAAAS